MFYKSFVLTVIIYLFGFIMTFALWAQEPGPLDTPLSREGLHLNTIGTYSAGFVLTAYGYIGILADVYYKKVYEPDRVRSMLGETISFLNNTRQQLILYHDDRIQISPADQAFIDGISSIIKDLVDEAEALSSYTLNSDEVEWEKFKKARENAWDGIKKYLGVN
jgi:hypothetical protein